MLDYQEWWSMLVMRANQRGFTLPELAIGMAIVAILASVGAPAFSSWREGAQVRSAAESISNALQLTRAEAVKRNANVSFTLVSTNIVPGSTYPDASWTVGCVTVAADCPATIQSQSSANVPPHVTVKADVTTVSFSGLGRATNDMTLEFQNPTGGNCAATGGPMRCLNTKVSKGGQILTCDPALSHATNPQGC